LTPSTPDRATRPAPGSSRAPALEPTVGAPTKPIDRERILERYRRPSAADSAKPDSGSSASPASADEVKARRDAARNEQDRKSNAGADDVRAARDAYRADQGKEVLAKRTEYRQKQVADVAAARSDYAAASAAKTKARRGEWNSAQEQSLEKRRERLAEAATRDLRDYAGANAPEHEVFKTYGSSLARCQGYTIGLGLGLGFSWCSPYGWYWNSYWNNCWSPNTWWWNGWDNCSSYGYWWGYGGYSYSWWCHPLSWNYRCWYGYWPSRVSSWWPGCYTRYWTSAPVYYSTIVADSYSDSPDPVVIYVDRDANVEVSGGVVQVRGATAAGEAVQYGGAQQASGGASNVGAMLERGPDTLSRAANQYLAQGDEAFRDRRYGDAVHFYAKAIEYRPNDGVMYLVLADALLATGDYHYGAFALRRALELEPTLASSDIDKHEFYADPAEFDDQLMLLERFLSDHQADADARLLLAANYLFAKKPALAIDLLESGASASVREEAAGQLVLEAAKKARGAR